MKSRSEIVRTYAKLYAEGYNSLPNDSHRKVLDLAPRYKKLGVETILDIGCGRGYLVRQLTILGFLVSGTEVVDCLFERDLKGLSVHQLPVHEMAMFEDESFSMCMLVNVLSHLKDRDEAVLAIKEATRISSKAVVIVVQGDALERTQFFSSWIWSEIVRKNAPGYEMEEVEVSPGSVLLFLTRKAKIKSL